MEVIGILNNKLCVLIPGARLILQLDLTKSHLWEINEYTDTPVFQTYEEVEAAAYS